ncbi:MAG: hypothetical protein FJY73_00385 [Candidatus Eisenbacteria bacterium]|nr:hypothetical protein [Candidatus Eisenbacteria bacterium]
MNLRSTMKTFRTSKRRTALLASAAAVLLGIAFAGPHLAGAAGGGAGWVVRQVVRAVAYRNVSPEDETAVLSARVRVAAHPGAPSIEQAGLPSVPEGEPSEEPAPPEELPAVDLVTPLEQEIEGRRPDLPSYRTFGLRDPMVPLVTIDGEQDDETQFSVYRLTLVGVAWNGERVALLEDPARKSYLYRVGEWTKDGGRVTDITENSITFAHVRYGEMTRFTLRLEAPKEEQ